MLGRASSRQALFRGIVKRGSRNYAFKEKLLQNANCKMQIANFQSQFAFCNSQFPARFVRTDSAAG